MSDFTKENNATIQRAELHRKIWAIADNVRGAVDGWDFKQYILGILFYRLKWTPLSRPFFANI